MPDEPIDTDDINRYYGEGNEQARLSRDTIELVRTRELILRHAPAAPAVVADLGGGSGPYAFWLAGLGYHVHLRDKMALHIEQARAAAVATADAGHAALASMAVGDARDVDLPDASADMVLLLGPLYHLTERADRLRALGEAHRLLRAGGVLLAAAISRYASVVDGMNRGFLEDPAFGEIVRADLATGQHRNPTQHPRYFTTAYFHQPEELRQETHEAGFPNAEVFAVEGPLWLARAAQEHWDDKAARERYLEALRWIERDPAMVAIGAHLLVVGSKTKKQPPLFPEP